MPRPQRLIAAAVLLSLSAVLTGCGGGMSGFDPTDLLDFLDTKKKLPGDRKPVFPEGVPGLQPGVPKDLYKGAAVEPEPAATPSPAPEPAGKKRGTTSRAKARNAAPAQTQAAPEVADPDVNVEDGSTAAAPPAPAPKRVVRRRTTAPPPDAAPAAPAQQPASASPFPAPMPSSTFSR